MKLITRDDVLIEVNEMQIAHSTVLTHLLSLAGDTDCPLPNVNARTFEVFLSWPAHAQQPKEFFTAHAEIIFDLVDAASYLDCEPMFQAVCAYVSNRLNHMEADDIRKLLNITDGFSVADQEQIHAENAFVHGSAFLKN